MHDDDLLGHREAIDQIDYQIHNLLNERGAHAIEIAKLKIADGAETLEDFYRPEREAEILSKISEHNEGPLNDYAVANIFRVIMSECLNLQSEAKHQDHESSHHDELETFDHDHNHDYDLENEWDDSQRDDQ